MIGTFGWITLRLCRLLTLYLCVDGCYDFLGSGFLHHPTSSDILDHLASFSNLKATNFIPGNDLSCYLLLFVPWTHFLLSMVLFSCLMAITA